MIRPLLLVAIALAACGPSSAEIIRTFPKVFSQSPDTPRGRELSRDDANWPGWADGKADKVHLAIHQKLSGCATKPSP
ncbi:MAG TPA: hypothetical protein VFU21_27940 [Kofleriaceae bacterium]|nr:hypothetical protein [Kofleriaceae bacterium]